MNMYDYYNLHFQCSHASRWKPCLYSNSSLCWMSWGSRPPLLNVDSFGPSLYFGRGCKRLEPEQWQYCWIKYVHKTGSSLCIRSTSHSVIWYKRNFHLWSCMCKGAQAFIITRGSHGPLLWHDQNSFKIAWKLMIKLYLQKCIFRN
jgi:hypothetical protein